MYVCMYVCIYVLCLFIRVSMYVCVVCMYVCMQVSLCCMYVYVCMYLYLIVLTILQCGAVSTSHTISGSREHRNVEIISDILFVSNICIGRGHHMRHTHTYR